MNGLTVKHMETLLLSLLFCSGMVGSVYHSLSCADKIFLINQISTFLFYHIDKHHLM